MLLDFGADVNGTTQFTLDTPLHTAARIGDSAVISLLIQKGSDLELRNRKGDTPLFIAAAQPTIANVHALLAANADRAALNRINHSFLDNIRFQPESCGIFVESVRVGVNPHNPTNQGVSAFHRAVYFSSFTSFIVNSDLRLEDSIDAPFNWDFDGSAPAWIDISYRFFRKKYRIGALETFANMTPSGRWSPLCRHASRGEVKPMENLLDLNCPLNYEGCPFGSALMAACVDGRMGCVVFLVRRGASLTYCGPNGYRSAYVAARKHKSILRWLLVGRFVDQNKLAPSHGLSDTQQDCQPITWRGPIKAEVVVSGILERWPKESSQAYWSRLQKQKLHWRGKVPPLARERRTLRPSNLIPVEKVRTHPDGYDNPRALKIHGNGDSMQDDKRDTRSQTTPQMMFDGLLWYTPWVA
ncbi:ankyrin repeat protein [Colletotrichum asianum]|uniref:Ankyrin repeat protein n=1 Tax=Colletotrichum asianum TaxID=702518 RepID=A0A8H3ZJR2_9PEZI|nr:ankyrin repeat protein [Colletotrichum asianum]